MGELVDPGDLKSPACSVSVRLRLLVPTTLGSSRGLGYRPFTASTRVRISYRVPFLVANSLAIACKRYSPP